MLAALAAVAIPIIIEWLFRRRKQQVELPTLRYLLRTKEQEKVRRQDRLLLILRTVALLVLVLALARPLLQPGWVGAARPRHAVILLDGTASMSQQLGVTTAFGLAQKKAAEMIRGLPPQTSVTVARLGDRVEAVEENSRDLHTTAARVEALRAGSGGAPMAEALAWAKDGLARAGDARAELYLFSDFHKHTWQRKGAGPEGSEPLLRELSARAETFLVDVGGAPAFNYILGDLRPSEGVISTAFPARFLVSVRATGTPPAGALARVTLLVDGVKKDVREVRPTAGPSVVPFEHRFQSAGEFVVEAVLEGDDHRVDNRRLYLAAVPDEVRVLIVDETGARESAYLSRAIAPATRPGMDRVSPFAVTVIPPSQIAFENLESYSVVVLAAVGSPTEALVNKLEPYVAEAGALWVFLTPSANLYEYNKLFYKDGKGLLPCRLGAKIASESPGLRFAGSDHSAVQEFAAFGGVKEIGLGGYVSMETTPGSDRPFRTVLALSNGSPALVEHGFGRGKVLLAGMTAGTEWTYLPAMAEFPMLVHEILRYFVGRPDAGVNLDVGDRFEQPVFVSAQHVLLRCPDGRKERLTPKPAGAGWRIAFDRTSAPGLYEVDAPPEVVPRRRFVVNPTAEEGDLARFTREEFREFARPGRWTWVGPERPIEDLAARLHSVIELSPALLWALAAVLGVESFLAVRFGRRRGAPLDSARGRVTT